MIETFDEGLAREKIALVKAQPKKWLFGIDKAIDIVGNALFTYVPYTSQGKKLLGQASVLLLDVPGTGKTDMLRCFSFAIGAKVSFILGRADMLPRDVLGGEIPIGPGKFLLRKGPLMSHIVHFDEINRAPEKAQSPALQAMEERIAVLDVTDPENGIMLAKAFPLFPVTDDPAEERLFFWFVATANPVEQEGTYEIPEAQRDRFTYSLSIGYPPRDEEKKIRAGNVMDNGRGGDLRIEQIISLPEVLGISDLIFRSVQVGRNASEYIQRLMENSRPYSGSRDSAKAELRDFVDTYVANGISPRANYHFEAAAKTFAFMNRHKVVEVEDVKEVAPFIMQHRLILAPSAHAAGKTGAEIVQEILKKTVVLS